MENILNNVHAYNNRNKTEVLGKKNRDVVVNINRDRSKEIQQRRKGDEGAVIHLSHAEMSTKGIYPHTQPGINPFFFIRGALINQGFIVKANVIF